MIYLDNAATTALSRTAWEAMQPYFTEYYGNPSSIYRLSANSKKAINRSREAIAETLGAGNREIFFTSGGSESDNWALVGIAEQYADKGKHIITTKIEHEAVLQTCAYLERRGYEVTYLDVDADGLVLEENLRKALRPDTILVSVMFANNEVGTIQDVAKLSKIAHDGGAIFHTDAVQAYGHLPISVKEMGIDLLSASGHKFGGPKGIGFLYVNEKVKLPAFIHGGMQEKGRRAGTENVPAIVGMAAAAKEAASEMADRERKEKELSSYLLTRLLEEIPYTNLHGHTKRRLANNVNVSFRFVQGESMLIMLDQKGVCASAGSACTTGAMENSHVLLALGLDDEEAAEAIRFTVSHLNTTEELDEVVSAVKEIVEKLRANSIAYERFMAGAK